MISFWRIFWLEIIAFARSKTIALLAVASIGWMFACPYLVKGDGTTEGAREIYVHFSLGGVFALLVITLLASAAGSLARERAAKRLQLTLVRPVRYSVVVLGKGFAHVAVGALVLAVACCILAFREDLSCPCSHVLSPVLPSPAEEAKAMYESYMKDPATPAQVKRTKKSVVLRLLAQRAIDHYQTIGTNETAVWRFDAKKGVAESDAPALRLRFTNQFEMRQSVLGEFAMDGLSAVISNITQAVLTVPLKAADVKGGGPGSLAFANKGKSALMLRPRRDINLLLKADSFGMNLLRAYCELVAILALVVFAGLFLSSGLGQPVALFVAFVTLIVSEMSPSVIEQYPDELETKTIDHIGLMITRFAADVTRPVSALSPLESLAKDECVESREMLSLVAVDLCLLPIFLSLLSAFVLPRKQDDI